MAARRLLIVMLVLLGISSAIAVMVPEPERDDPAAPETAATGQSGATGATGATGNEDSTGEPPPDAGDPAIRTSVDLDAKKPVRISVPAGSRMILTVKSAQGSDVEIEGLGLTGFADPYAPAIFDVILPSEPGRFQVGAPGEKARAAVLITSRSGDAPVQIESERAP